MRLPTFLGLLFAGSLLAGCAADAVGEGDSSEGDSAIKTGTRFTSPLAVGDYDSDDATLSIDTLFDRQVVTIRYRERRISKTCRGDLDRALRDGKLTVQDEQTGCSVELQKDADAIEVVGHVTGRFVLRSDGALDGTYEGELSSGSLVVRRSPTGRSSIMEFTLLSGETRFDGSATDEGYAFTTRIDECEAHLYVDRKGGKYTILLSPQRHYDAACANVRSELFTR